jgi:alkanesulfonate monooxygenase SsuD/methylene tetrahydromethanopterin reductase-like flavin-dependent oxidoreductase (luciferase family)
MRLGSAILLGPFQHPVRFAEDVAVVDQLSGGRLEVGLGLGYREREFEVLGVPRSERARRTEELVLAARQAWRDGTLTPPPFQQPEPPFWIGGSSAAAARRAARLGCSFMPDAYVETEVVDSLPVAGRTGRDQPVDLRRVMGEVAPHFLYQYNRYREWGGGRQLAGADELPRDRYLIGSPPRSRRGEGAGRANEGGAAVLLARPPGLLIELANHSLERFAKEVIPLVEAAARA